LDRIRNFSIIAHIDHGKSTLADRLIEATHAVPERELKDQVLDTMDLERERGITIKAQACALDYRAHDGKDYLLNLIDTPGHVDFTYEVTRSLACCEGVLLVVDATQGVQAQTIANFFLALESNLEIIPVINKIDLQTADIEGTKAQMESELGLNPKDAILASARVGTGVDEILEAIVKRIPPPRGAPADSLRALIFNSQYDSYRGAVITCRVFDGSVRPGESIRFFSGTSTYLVEEVGILRLHREPRPALEAGEVGYVIAGIKRVSETRVGDTITHAERPAQTPLPGYREVQPVVFSSLYPSISDDYPELADALEKFKLRDPALVYQKDSSISLGFGFRCGFLGLLHLDIVQERLEREFGLSLILTAPSVQYRVNLTGGEQKVIDNPLLFPDPSSIASTEEPFIKAEIITPEAHVGKVHTICQDHRGQDPVTSYLGPKRWQIRYDMPLAEVLYDFYDKLKSATKGYASFNYDLIGYRPTDLVKLDILVNGDKVDALSQLVHRSRAETIARRVCERLREAIPRQLVKIAIQGAIGGRIISRETISALRKDVLQKCYGGDVTRKRKLLEKQKEGKKRMKMVGQVEIPQAAFLAVLKTHEDDA
jgi:GTP-binding protein LepA